MSVARLAYAKAYSCGVVASFVALFQLSFDSLRANTSLPQSLFAF